MKHVLDRMCKALSAEPAISILSCVQAAEVKAVVADVGARWRYFTSDQRSVGEVDKVA